MTVVWSFHIKIKSQQRTKSEKVCYISVLLSRQKHRPANTKYKALLVVFITINGKRFKSRSGCVCSRVVPQTIVCMCVCVYPQMCIWHWGPSLVFEMPSWSPEVETTGPERREIKGVNEQAESVCLPLTQTDITSLCCWLRFWELWWHKSMMSFRESFTPVRVEPLSLSSSPLPSPPSTALLVSVVRRLSFSFNVFNV